MSQLKDVTPEVSQKKETSETNVLNHRVQLIVEGTMNNMYFVTYFNYHLSNLMLVSGQIYFFVFHVFEYPKVNSLSSLLQVLDRSISAIERTDYMSVIFPAHFGCTMYYFDQSQNLNSDDAYCFTKYMELLEISCVLLVLMLCAILIINVYEILVTLLKLYSFSAVTRYDIKKFHVLETLTFSQKLKLILLSKNIDSVTYKKVLEQMVLNPKVAHKAVTDPLMALCGCFKRIKC